MKFPVTLPLLLFLLYCGEKYEFREMPVGIDADARLVSSEGSLESLGSDKPLQVLFFGFTRCPDFCPLVLSKIDSAVRAEKLEEKIRLSFVSIDVPRDHPGDLKKYLSPFPYARGFTGTKEQIAHLERQLGAYSRESAGVLSHSLYIYVLNRRGRVIYLLRHDDTASKIRGVLRQAAAL